VSTTLANDERYGRLAFGGGSVAREEGERRGNYR